jgi:hypothetical protein
MPKRPILPRDMRIANQAGELTNPWLRFFDDLNQPIPNVKPTGNANTDIAALIQALIDAGIMKKAT